MNQVTRFCNLFRYSFAIFELFAVICARKKMLTYWEWLTTLRYRILIESFIISSIRKRTVFVYHYESILLLPTATTQFAEIL